jgi:hypothetical protein
MILLATNLLRHVACSLLGKKRHFLTGSLIRSTPVFVATSFGGDLG